MRSTLGYCATIVWALVAASASGGVWTESPDADPMPMTAQQTVGSGPLNTIYGTLPSDSDIDMFAINIVDKNSFTAAITPLSAFADPDIWLFDASGYGIALNDSVTGGQAWITGSLVPANGLYYLAVTSDGADAISSGGNIWNSAWFSGQRAPDGPGATQPIIGWGGTPINDLINYTVQLNGAEFTQSVPEPTALSTLGFASLGLAGYIWRRRRKGR